MRDTMRSSCGGSKYGSDWAPACVDSAQHITNTASTMAKILPVTPCSRLLIWLADITTLLGTVIWYAAMLLKSTLLSAPKGGVIRRRHAYLNPGCQPELLPDVMVLSCSF